MAVVVVVVIDHAVKMHELPDEYLADALPIAKKIAVAQGAENYNILQVGAARPSTRGWSTTTAPGLTIHRFVIEQWTYRASGADKVLDMRMGHG